MADMDKTELDRLQQRVVQEMVTPALEATQEWTDLWSDALRYTFFDQISHLELGEGMEHIQDNILFPAVVQQMAIYSQRNPVLHAEGFESSDAEYARIWDQHIPYLWRHVLQMKMQLMRATLDTQLFGYAVAKVTWNDRHTWDEREQKWLGQPCLRVINPSTFGVDPEAESLEDASYVVSRRLMLTRELLVRYPDMKDEILSVDTEQMNGLDFWPNERLVDEDDSYDDQARRGLLSEGRLMGLISEKHSNRRENAMVEIDNHKVPRYMPITEVYWRDPEEVKENRQERIPEEELEDQDEIDLVNGVFLWKGTGEPITNDNWPTRDAGKHSRPVYPRGRYVMMLQDSILNRGEDDQVWTPRHWPFVTVVNTMLPHIWQGVNQVEPAKGLQDYVNVTMSGMATHTRKMAHPKVVVEEGALVNDPDLEDVGEEFRIRGGSILKVTSGRAGGVRNMEGASMPSSVINFYEMVSQSMQDQLGMQDMTFGKQQSQMTATEAAALASNSRLRPALHAWYMDQYTLDIMRRVIDLCQMYYDPSQIIRTVNQDTGALATMKANRGMLDSEFDLTIDVTTALPWDRQRKQQDLASITQIFPESRMALLPYALDLWEIPDKQQILADTAAYQDYVAYKEQQEAITQNQQQAQGNPQ